jgi:YD repeat-containing protein
MDSVGRVLANELRNSSAMILNAHSYTYNLGGQRTNQTREKGSVRSIDTSRTNLLDLTATKDRLGNWTYFTYNAIRQRVAITNALNKLTQYTYCSCGQLESITEGVGTPEASTLSYSHDLQGRLASRTFSVEDKGVSPKY